jgi:hypothetical protein
MAIAFCDRRGIIEIEAKLPEGMLELARGRRAALERLMCAAARHAYDGKTRLVPGIPEAETDDQALNAAITFREWLAKRRDAKPVAKRVSA